MAISVNWILSNLIIGYATRFLKPCEIFYFISFNVYYAIFNFNMCLNENKLINNGFGFFLRK